MLLKADSKEIVLLHLTTGINIVGLLLYNSSMENIKFVLEKREFFDIEHPFILTEKGLIKMPNNYITIQRCNVVFYTLDIPTQIKNEVMKFINKLNEIKREIINGLNNENVLQRNNTKIIDINNYRQKKNC